MYNELRRIAQREVSKEYGQATVQATEIAHEAYLKLVATESLTFESRAHLLATVARAIRLLLVDRARARKAKKRGGASKRVLLDDVLDCKNQYMPELLNLEVALEELDVLEARCAKMVELRFYGGMSVREAASVLNISERAAANDWAFARAWLRRRLERGEN